MPLIVYRRKMSGTSGSRAVCAGLALLGALELANCGSSTSDGGGSNAGTPAASGAAGESSAHGGAGAKAGSAGTENHAGQAGDAGNDAAGASSAGDAGTSGTEAGGGAGTSGTAGTSGMSGTGGTLGSGGTSGAAGTLGSGGTSGTAGTAGAISPPGPAPLGLVAFYDATTSQCPTGWSRDTAADGRLLLSTTNAGLVGATKGVAFNPQEERMHTHTYTVQLNLGSHGLTATSGSFTQAAAGGTATSTGVTGFGFSNLPYMELVACKLDTDLGQGDGFPIASVAHFDKTTCPDGWAAYGAADNRVVLPAPGVSGNTVGFSSQHTHSLPISQSLLTVSIAAAAGSSFPVASTQMGADGTTDPEGASGEPPTLTLLVCRKSAAPASNAVVPSGALTTTDNQSCPDTWERYTKAEGVFLVGAMPNAQIGQQWGSVALAAGEQRMHTHPVAGGATLIQQNINTTLGSAGVYGQTGSTPFYTTTGPGTIEPPRIELRTCKKL